MVDRVRDLLVDIQAVQGGFFGNRGIRRYALGLARALLARGGVRALLLNPSRPCSEELPDDLHNAGKLEWSTRRRLRELDASGATAYIATAAFELSSPAESVFPSFVTEAGIPFVAILYDLIPEIVDVYPPELMSKYWPRRRLVREADLLLTLSDHVRRDAIERLDVPAERVATIGAAASGFFRPRGPGEASVGLLGDHGPEITRPFVLSVTGWSAHKNAEGLIQAWSRLPNDIRAEYQLVLTCPLPPGAETAWSELAGGFGLRPDELVVTGHVDDNVVRALYQQAELFVLPSYEEGFGLPVLEAALCGCPAISSSASSLPEVLEWEPSTFAPDDVDEIAAAVERGVRDPSFRADLRAVGDAAARRHTWDRVAERTIGACASHTPVRRPRRVAAPRVALVGRFTPSTGQSAIAAERVTELLVPHCRVDRFDTGATSSADAPAVREGARPDGVGNFPVRALGSVRDPWGYDDTVYIVDDQPADELRDLARSNPGAVWFVAAPSRRLVATELARGASVIVCPPDASPLTVDAGPFGRVARVVETSGDTMSAARALVDAIDLLAAPALS